ncbi:MAG: hypothetical protein JSV00_08790 [bacterium]|nr:MAG: hypothetical protein JSV00_08790 [bacterium]
MLWKIYADYDGIIDLGDELLLEKTLLAVEKGSARDLEEKVYMESRHILCPACREEILETLSSLEEMRSEAGSDEEGGEERNLH